MSNVQAGDLNKRISISKTIMTTVKGMQIKSFDTTNAIGTWAKINGISNENFYADNNSENIKHILNFTIRYRASVDTTMLIKYNSKYYEITDVDDYMEQHIFLTLRAREVNL